MVQIPKVIAKVFDTFPLRVYDMEPSSVTDAANRFHFKSETQVNNGNSFTIGVHNVIELNIGNQSILIPSDPVSFGHSLILCYKNNLRLPSTKQDQNSSASSIMAMSFNASPDLQLPILIEDLKESRSIKTYPAIRKSIELNNIKNNTEHYLLNEMIDQQLYDLWILCLLTEEITEDTLLSIFKVDKELKAVEAISRLEAINIFSLIPKWNSFKIRHPTLFVNRSLKLDRWTISEETNRHAMEILYDRNLKLFKRDFGSLIAYSKNASEDFKVVELKIIGFVVIIDTLLRDTKLGNILSTYQNYVDYCYKVLEDEFC
ncbi:uncharacterized protein PRCAT00001537001 [Priceomyces carsonii]|uniref:uncharacterized protein n=1 Tax=Priceomyces carsonii TaxID=28549 RepID=UPI002EDA6423|nr:unnamed protein product [Priceomyces carsonii]